jgi:SAM-dependent methyltransferase
MKRCLWCDTTFSRPEWICPACGRSPGVRDGVRCFAPEVVGADESYDPAWYEELQRLEENNFWFRARNRLIGWLAKRHLPAEADFLEIGCGTGYVLWMLRREFSRWRITGSEAHLEGLQFAARRVGAGVVFEQIDARAIPYREEFDAIGAFDVIEHIREDAAVLKEVHAALKPGGFLLASVPQHMFLWSRYDEVGRHFRRYSLRELAEKLDAAGLRIVESTSFNTLLLPLMLVSRFVRRSEDLDVLDELRIGRVLNAALSGVLWLEFALVRLGMRWPVGGSRVFVARKIV